MIIKFLTQMYIYLFSSLYIYVSVFIFTFYTYVVRLGGGEFKNFVSAVFKRKPHIKIKYLIFVFTNFTQ